MNKKKKKINKIKKSLEKLSTGDYYYEELYCGAISLNKFIHSNDEKVSSKLVKYVKRGTSKRCKTTSEGCSFSCYFPLIYDISVINSVKKAYIKELLIEKI